MGCQYSTPGLSAPAAATWLPVCAPAHTTASRCRWAVPARTDLHVPVFCRRIETPSRCPSGLKDNRKQATVPQWLPVVKCRLRLGVLNLNLTRSQGQTLEACGQDQVFKCGVPPYDTSNRPRQDIRWQLLVFAIFNGQGAHAPHGGRCQWVTAASVS